MIFKNLVSIAVVAMTASVAHATDLYVYSLSRTAPPLRNLIAYSMSSLVQPISP